MKRVFCRLVIACGAAAAGCSAPAPPARDAKPPHVILITIDTLRADHVGRGFTPALDALARDGITFSTARATAPLTLPSHVSILTGTLPPEHGARENGVPRRQDSAPTLARILRDRGYQTAAFVGAYVLDRRFGLADGFDLYDDRIRRDPRGSTRLEAERRGDEVVAAARDWLSRADPKRPAFIWVHLYDPHAPYTPPAAYLSRAGGNAYRGEVAFVDDQVAALLHAVRSRFGGHLLIAAAGDHGEGLGDHGETTHGMLAYDSTLRVPLLLAGAGIDRGTRIDAPVSLRDLAPTLLARLGVAPPGGMTGRDLLSSQRSETYAETIYPRAAGWSPLRVIADERWKFIGAPAPELYDIRRDPGETRDVAAQNASIAAAMQARAEALFGAAAAEPPALSREASERLRALGYVSAGRSAPAPANAPHPRETIGAWNRFEQALSLLSAGRSADAVPSLRDLAARFPDSRVFQSTYARALADTGRRREALALYRNLASRWSDDATLFHDLAVVARAAGDAAEAMKAEQAAIALDPRDPNPRNGLGLLHAEAGRAPDAAAAFEAAIALDPNSASFWANLGNARRALGQLDRAGQAYERARQLDPGHADALNGLGVVRVQQGRAAEAVALLERAVSADPALYEAQLNLGIALQESGDSARAAGQYRKVIATAPPGAKEKRAAQELLAALPRSSGTRH